MTSPITDLLDYHLRAGHTPGAMVHVERDGQVLARHVAGRTIHRRYGQAVRERFDAWVSRRNPQWAQWTDVVDAVRTGSPAPQPVQH